MKKIGFLLLILTIFLIFVENIGAQITTSPSSISIPRGLQATRRITYSITSPGCTSAISNSGTFISGSTILGVVNTTVSTNLTGTGNLTTGTATETLILPIQVIKKAEQLRINRFEFRRQFNLFDPNPCATYNSSVQVALTSEATAEFMITRLQLYFENGRAEITVKRNQPGLKAYAEIRYVGSGLLQGYWEVDGRILSHVNRHLVYGRSLTLESPEIPSLPTFTTGTHIVRFLITNPSLETPSPEAIYFVTAEEFKKIFSINLISPEDKSEIDFIPPTFRWEEREPTVTYLIEFLEEGVEKPIFSAYSRKSEYTLPIPVFKNLFFQTKGYLWRVKGFDVDNNKVGESPLFKFTFKEHSLYIPRQR